MRTNEKLLWSRATIFIGIRAVNSVVVRVTLLIEPYITNVSGVKMYGLAL